MEGEKKLKISYMIESQKDLSQSDLKAQRASRGMSSNKGIQG